MSPRAGVSPGSTGSTGSPGSKRGAQTADDCAVFRLYVSAASPVSSRAIVNARRFFDLHLPAQHTLEVLDIASHVASARADHIVASPTLLRVAPLPQRRFIGDMSDTERLRLALGLPRQA